MNAPAGFLRRPRQLSLLFLVLGTLLAAWVYAPALDSGLYLDSTKLYQLERVYEEQGSDVAPGDIGFGSETGRIVSQVSFYLNIVATDGLDIRAVKLTNLVIHVVNAILVYFLATMMLARTRLADRRVLIGGFVALLWLLSAVNLSGVVYAVQRMNQLSTCFSLLALILYMHLRGAVEAGSASVMRIGPALAGVLLSSLLAYGSKENGVLVVVFIAVIEFYLYPTVPRLVARPRNAVLAGLAAAGLLVLATAWISTHYWVDAEMRGFTMSERVLTQARILWVYIGQSILPSSLATGLYQDGFPVSTSLFSPVTTAIGIVGVLALIAFAIVYRANDTLKPIAFGIAFFLGGHLLESTILPLELYFEHRNYLPSVGLYLALAAAAYSLLTRFRPAIAVVAVVAYLGFFTAMSHAKSVTWSDERFVYETALARPYLSPRAASERAQSFLEQGRLEPALGLLDRVIAEVPAQAFRARLQVLFVHCLAGFPPDEKLYAELAEATGRELGIEVSQALQNLLGAYERTRCQAIVPDRLLRQLAAVSGDIRAGGRSAWHIDYYIAAFLLLSNAASAADWLEARFLEGEESAGWMLLDLLGKKPDIKMAPETRQSLDALKQR